MKNESSQKQNIDSFCVTFCENVECVDCPVYIENYETRTIKDKQNHAPCVINLVEWVKMQCKKEERNDK